MKTSPFEASYIQDQIKRLLDSHGFDEGGYKVVLELWGEQQFKAEDEKNSRKSRTKLEFSRLSKHYSGETK